MSATATTPDSLSTDELSTLAVILEGTARATGQEFFRSLVRHLATAVGTRYAFVAEFAEGTRRGCAPWRTGFGTESSTTTSGTYPALRAKKSSAAICAITRPA